MKIEHMDGAHDDILMSYLIGLYAILYLTEYMKRFVKITNDLNSNSSNTQSDELQAKRVQNLKKIKTHYSENTGSVIDTIERKIDPYRPTETPKGKISRRSALFNSLMG